MSRSRDHKVSNHCVTSGARAKPPPPPPTRLFVVDRFPLLGNCCANCPSVLFELLFRSTLHNSAPFHKWWRRRLSLLWDTRPGSPTRGLRKVALTLARGRRVCGSDGGASGEFEARAPNQSRNSAQLVAQWPASQRTPPRGRLFQQAARVERGQDQRVPHSTEMIEQSFLNSVGLILLYKFSINRCPYRSTEISRAFVVNVVSQYSTLAIGRAAIAINLTALNGVNAVIIIPVDLIVRLQSTSGKIGHHRKPEVVRFDKDILNH